MKIMIPSRGRAHEVHSSTLSRLPESVIQDTVLWVHSDEYDEYRSQLTGPLESVELVHSQYSRIGEKREQMGRWCQDRGVEKFCMMDDDVDFLVRKSHDDWRLREALDFEIGEMLHHMEYWLGRGYAQVAISPREGNNRFGEGLKDELYADCTRAMRITAYSTRDFMSVEHDRVPVMEDFDVLLQLLRSGRKNKVLAYWANGQKMTNAPGGCSIWRTLDLHNGAVERMAELHPGFVKVREKQNKTDSEGFGTRKEVTVQWKRAYQSSQS